MSRLKLGTRAGAELVRQPGAELVVDEESLGRVPERLEHVHPESERALPEGALLDQLLARSVGRGQLKATEA